MQKYKYVYSIIKIIISKLLTDAGVRGCAACGVILIRIG